MNNSLFIFVGKATRLSCMSSLNVNNLVPHLLQWVTIIIWGDRVLRADYPGSWILLCACWLWDCTLCALIIREDFLQQLTTELTFSGTLAQVVFSTSNQNSFFSSSFQKDTDYSLHRWAAFILLSVSLHCHSYLAAFRSYCETCNQCLTCSTKLN